MLLDVTPRQVLRSRATGCPTATAAQLGRYRYGPGVFKVDLALDGPVPWRAADCRARRARSTSAARSRRSPPSEAEVAAGREPERPFVLLAQQSLFDPAGAPAGKHTAWAYCHVPERLDAPT